MSAETLGQCLRRERRTARLSLRQLAEKSGVSSGALCDIENGIIKDISLTTACRIGSVISGFAHWAVSITEHELSPRGET